MKNKSSNKKATTKEIAKEQPVTGPTAPLSMPGNLPGQQLVHEERFTGPMPPPNILAGYKNIDPSFPERMMKEFEANSSHIREMERLSLQSTVERDKRGQYMAFGLSLFLLLIVLFSLYLGNIVFAGVSGFFFFGFIIRAFLVKPGQNKQNQVENTNTDDKK